MHTRAYRSCTRRRGHSSLLPFSPLPLFLPDEGRFERTSGKVYREATNGWQLGDASVAICIGVGRVETSRPLSLSPSFLVLLDTRLSSRPRKNEPWRSGINRFTVTGRITGDTSWRLIPRALIKNSLVYVSSGIDGYFRCYLFVSLFYSPRVVQWKKEVIAYISYFFG